jgi:hypothetical protein
MRKSFVLRSPGLWLIAVIVTPVLFCLAYFYVVSKRPPAPKVLIVSSCRKLQLGLKRIGEPYGIQFDIPAENFAIDEWAADAPPGGETFRLRPQNGASYLFIDFGPSLIQSAPKARIGVPIPEALLDSGTSGNSRFSGHADKREVFDDKGKPVGEDSWGYTDGDQRWRRVLFRKGLVVARYGSIKAGDVASSSSVHQEETALFDQVINSACIIHDAP